MRRSTAITIGIGLALLGMCAASCGPRRASNDTASVPDGTPFEETCRFAPERPENAPKLLLFVAVTPQWLAHRVEYFASIGVKGVMVKGIMPSWRSDIWQLPNNLVPDAPEGRIVGAENPLFLLCRQTNEACARHGITENSIKVAYYRRVPDWFDDEAWAQAAENFRQCAIFARDAGFRGVTIDIEYIKEMYNLTWSGYDSTGYTRRSDEEMLAAAERRGYQIMSAMVTEFPEMVNWHLPESAHYYGPLAGAHVLGMICALAERDAPGGFHISTEDTYKMVAPRSIVHYTASLGSEMREFLGRGSTQYPGVDLLDYWDRRGSINLGLWPLGYCRKVRDEHGRVLGWTGREETFHGALVGASADKSANYTVRRFREQLGTVVAIGEPYYWIYCQGQVFWQMTPEEMVRFRGNASDTIHVADNLDEYIAVMREARPIANPSIAGPARLAREGRIGGYAGVPPVWEITGPYAGGTLEAYQTACAPETTPDSPGLEWRAIRATGDGLMDLRESVERRPGFTAYGRAEFELDRAQQVLFRFGCNDWGSIFLDGRKVFEYADPSGRRAVPDQDIFVMNLSPGRHALLIECGDMGGSAWWYSFRITDMNDGPVPGLRWIGPPPGSVDHN